MGRESLDSQEGAIPGIDSSNVPAFLDVPLLTVSISNSESQACVGAWEASVQPLAVFGGHSGDDGLLKYLECGFHRVTYFCSPRMIILT